MAGREDNDYDLDYLPGENIHRIRYLNASSIFIIGTGPEGTLTAVVFSVSDPGKNITDPDPA